jgi:4-hydroxybenzoate polyprenyltransferase
MIGVDTIVLAGLYTVRIVAGSYACGLIPTFWILAFSMFLFLSLAMVKRYSELLDARKNGNNEKTMGRGYFPADLEIIANLGVSSGYLSVLVLALYVQDVRTIQMYHAHELIWLACPILLFWISRVWMITHRGLMHDDPVLFAIKDKVSLLTGALFATVFVLATMF